jgi:hypothetical protein
VTATGDPPALTAAAHGGTPGAGPTTIRACSGTSEPKTPTPSPATLEIRTRPEGLKLPPRTPLT